MKFGKVSNPNNIDFNLPPDHPETYRVLKRTRSPQTFNAYIGCTKWSRAGLPGFYPRGTEDELSYYSKHFNSVEFNATFYRQFSQDQYTRWRNAVPEKFKFFPKVDQYIGHLRRLNPEGLSRIPNFVDGISVLEDRLGTAFLQLHPNFSTKYLDRVVDFVKEWPGKYKLGIEFRHESWYSDTGLIPEMAALLQEYKIAHIITDTAGRRDLLHMQLTNEEAFIRFVAVNHEMDYHRLDDWIERLKKWKEQGLCQVEFFIHQAMGKDIPFLASYFAKKVNDQLGLKMTIPQKL